MKAYAAVRDWIDRCWAGPNYKAIGLPIAIMFLVALSVENRAVMTVAWVGFGLWTSFCGWRWWLLMRAVLEGDDPCGINTRKNKNDRKSGR